MSTEEITVVPAHGAWAGGSSWARVIGGLRAVAAQPPLTSFDADVAALARVGGPVVLAPYAYAGAAIGAA